jgi:protein SMG6
MTTLHPFPTSRESILSIWSHAAQARRSVPDAKASDLFILLHGMLFTNIQLDDFQPTLARFIERLEIEGAEEREWIMMGIVNIASIMEYGRPGGVLRKVGCVGSKEVGGHGPQAASAIAMRVQAKKVAAGISKTALGGVDEERMDVDEEHHAHHLSPLSHHPSRSMDSVMKSPTLPDAEPQTGDGAGASRDSNGDGIPDHPPAFKFALQLVFQMLSSVLRHPTRKPSQYARSTLNPYLTVILTFLATVLKHRPTLETLERSIPWADLATFFAVVPRKIMISQGLMVSPKHNSPRHVERWIMLTSGCSPPLSEDWCLRGMEWVGRKVFERGFWKSGEEKKAELEVLEMVEGKALTDGTIEDDDGDDGGAHKTSSGSGSELVSRWVRIIRCGVDIASAVDGFNWVEGSREWNIEDKLAEKVTQWKEEDQAEQEEEERRRMGRRWTEDPMDVDADAEDDGISEESEDDENDSEEVKALKASLFVCWKNWLAYLFLSQARRRYLKSLIQSAKRESAISSSPPRRRPRAHAPKKTIDSRAPLSITPGYTVLVVDTNILLSSLSMVSSLIESLRWTIIIPLPVIMELDGLSVNSSQLGEAAQAAMTYISSHIRSHALSLKVQTSKGNYLTSLSVRTEEVNFDSNHANVEKNMDDLILKAAIWQDDHWVDRTAMLKADAVVVSDAVKVVLLSLDRNRVWSSLFVFARADNISVSVRLKARSRQLPAASEKDLAALLATAR